MILYVHDDLTDEVHARHGVGSTAVTLATEILTLVRRPHVVVLTLAPQLDALVAQGPRAPFALALGIGPAGERVARQVHARTGWFPAIRQVDLAREEDGRGGYAVVSLGAVPLAEQLAGVEAAASLAIVDDTIFSGITLRTLLAALPARLRVRASAFCLRGVAESLPDVGCPIAVGFAAPGKLLEEVSFINASGLVRRGAIRRAGAPPLAFFERPEWMRDWFGEAAGPLVERCARLNALLEPDGRPSLPAPV
ncbi:MAG TPA: hypothetical protein VMQ51_03285 [Candidatus Binatia bacterium]|nr:hypothetical protein [Candidatus Binatia bacterium]